ncbi:MAG: hypothetical protein J7K51_08585 [Thermotogae bacterium]|nr:hypothetical protein [Thermotogota bacterium]
MAKTKYTGDRTTKWIRWIARIWSTVIIAFALLTLIGYAWNWVTTGKADPYALENYPRVENLIPITLGLSFLGLGIAWRWERLGGAIAIVFQLATLAVHYWLLSPRPYPYPLTIAIMTPGILFLVCWWRSRKRIIP